MRDEVKQVLLSTPLFSGLNDDELLSALEFFNAQEASYSKGSFLRHCGDPMNRFGLVLSGNLHIFTDDINGNQMLMATVTRGDTFGESLCYLGIVESPIYIVAVEDTTLLWLSTARMTRPSESYEGRFITMLANRTLNMNDRIQVLSKRSLRDKIMTFLSQMVIRTGTSTFDVPFNRNSMAAYFGTDRSALSRELSKMKDEGIIDFERNRFTVIVLPEEIG